MRILILGSTGPLGIALCREALLSIPEASLVLFVRSPHKLPSDLLSNNRVTVITGQLTDVDLISKAMEGVDAVCSALGPTSVFHATGEPLAHAYEGIIEVMKRHGVRRLLALNTGSFVAPEDRFDIRFAALVTSVAVFARNAYKDVIRIGEVISKQDDLDWTIVRVPILNDKPDRDFIAGYIGDGKVNTGLSRIAFSVFVVAELKDGESMWKRKIPMLCNP